MSRSKSPDPFNLELHEQALERGYTVFTYPCPWCPARRDQPHQPVGPK